MNIKNLLFSLSGATAIGNVDEACVIAEKQLSKYMPTKRLNGLTVVGTLENSSEKTVMLEAHIDEVGFIVTDVSSDGFLTVKNCGGIDIRTLPSREVTIHGKQKIPGVFCSTPPHLSGDEVEYKDISVLKIDTFLSNKARQIVSVGDYVTFSSSPCELLGNRVTGKSFDNRAGVCCLLEVARRLEGKKLGVNLVLVFSDMEELGLRGAKTASYSVAPDEAIVVDVSFADAPDVSPEECGKLGGGAMIGISPVLDKEISNRLEDIAKQKKIPYQLEVMGRSTGTNGDVISVSRGGIKTGLISIPLRNMHTDVEIVDLDDISAAADLICEYILERGNQ